MSQEATIGSNGALIGKEVEVIDKYVSDVTRFNFDTKKYFSSLLGQCSSSIEQSLVREKDYKDIREKSDSIALIIVINPMNLDPLVGGSD